MERLERVIGLIQQTAIPGELWIDGSFLTNKLNPDDVDLIFVVNEADYRGLSQIQLRFFNWFRSTPLYDSHRIDNYVFVRGTQAADEWNYAYWLRQFGFSRADHMKGIPIIRVPFLVTP